MVQSFLYIQEFEIRRLSMLLGSETLFKVFVLQDVFHSALDLGREHFKLANSDSEAFRYGSIHLDTFGN